MSNALASITQYLTSIGCSFPDIGLLQPADPILDAAGENLRRRIFMTNGSKGETLCLRPEFTIPVCLEHLQSGSAQGRYAYAGEVFRQRSSGPSEFTQAGMEWFGEDGVAADVECITTALGALDAAGCSDTSLVMGDQAIFSALLNALGMPEGWQRQLKRNFGDTNFLNASLKRLSGDGAQELSSLPQEMIALVNDRDGMAIRISEKMQADGLSLTSGRTPLAIADRLIEKIELTSSSLEQEKLDVLNAFLEIDVPMEKAGSALAAFFETHKLDLGDFATSVSSTCNSLIEKSPSGCALHYRAGFGRRLDYYTGMVFEVYAGSAPQGKPIAGGGRYNNLATLLGAAAEQPASGFSIWLDRLTEAAQ